MAPPCYVVVTCTFLKNRVNFEIKTNKRQHGFETPALIMMSTLPAWLCSYTDQQPQFVSLFSNLPLHKPKFTLILILKNWRSSWKNLHLQYLASKAFVWRSCTEVRNCLFFY
jgi:hypothetical protein